MSVQAILMPVFAQVALTFVLLFWMQVLRLRAIRLGQVPAQIRGTSGSRTGLPRVIQIANAFHNQLETPLLFYVLILLALMTKTADSILLVLSWLFVDLALRPRLYPRHLEPHRPSLAGVPRRRHRPCPDVDHRRRPPDHRVERMTPGARASAAIEVLADIEGRKRPAAEALKDWGLSHRFAGSGDRAAIGNLVFDALRTRASAAYAMGEDSPRALVLRTLASHWGLGPDGVAALADGGRFAPAPLSPAELEGLRRELAADAPAHVRGDYPEWLAPEFERAFGDGRGRGGCGARDGGRPSISA